MRVPGLVAEAIDALLELSVVGSFTRIGIAVRRRLGQWDDPAPGALAGRTVLVTGPTSGLGRMAAGDAARLGARVILVGRDRRRLERVRTDLVAATGDDRYPIIEADMGSLASVREAAAEIRSTEPRLDLLVDNAGAMFGERVVGPDGIEATLALLVVGPFTLIGGLLPLLRATTGARVIATTSGGQYTVGLNLDDLESVEGDYAGPVAYARAKRAQVSLIREWARRAGDDDLTFHAMHPGWTDTPGLEASLPRFHRLLRPLLRSAADGADTITWLACAPASTARRLQGRLLLDRRARPFDRAPWTRVTAGERRALWAAIVDRSGGPDPAPDAAERASLTVPSATSPAPRPRPRP